MQDIYPAAEEHPSLYTVINLGAIGVVIVSKARKIDFLRESNVAR
jgi:hypothetical protein